jgi:HAD superfamily hydrolase (TIGR01509 family)
VEAELTRELGLELTVDEAHELFLGKTVDGVLDAIATRAGKRPSSAWVYNWAFATAHAFLRELKSVDGVGVAVETLRRRGFRLAVASQSPLARVRLSLQVAGLAGQFGEHIYVTSMVARPKPAPDIYLLAAEKLGAAPANCIVIEDSPAGAAAALGAGMRVIGYAPGDTLDAMRATGALVIHTMDELIFAIDA